MIAVKLEGRLGNQLFQYAFIYATAKKLNVSFYIDKSIEDFIPARYFDLEVDLLRLLDQTIFSITGYKNIFRVHGKKAFYAFLQKILFKNKRLVFDNAEQPEKELQRIVDDCMYEGYFQSGKYFKDFKDDVRAQLTIKKKYSSTFWEIQKTLPSTLKKVVIHIRRTDYLTIDKNILLPLSYYKKAIEMIDCEDVFYILISDDPAFAESEFSYLTNKYISNNNEIIDLQFLIHADICILSNSSFSWWGAWLNNIQNKKVIAPANWLGFNEEKEYPSEITQPDWILVNAN